MVLFANTGRFDTLCFFAMLETNSYGFQVETRENAICWPQTLQKHYFSAESLNTQIGPNGPKRPKKGVPGGATLETLPGKIVVKTMCLDIQNMPVPVHTAGRDHYSV